MTAVLGLIGQALVGVGGASADPKPVVQTTAAALTGRPWRTALDGNRKPYTPERHQLVFTVLGMHFHRQTGLTRGNRRINQTLMPVASTQLVPLLQMGLFSVVSNTIAPRPISAAPGRVAVVNEPVQTAVPART